MYLTIDGEQIETTPEHPFYTSEGMWKPAATLQPGDKIRQADGSTGEVEAVRVLVKPQEMYNFTVAAAHTYFVGEGQWLVHNTCNLKSRPFAQNADLNSGLIEQMYRGQWVNGQWVSVDTYAGGLAGAIRREVATGQLVGGLSHLQKGQDRLQQMKNILRTGSYNGQLLDASDIDIVRALHDDLLKALQGN